MTSNHPFQGHRASMQTVTSQTIRAAFATFFFALMGAGVAQAGGTVPGFNLTPQFDKSGKVMPGCKIYVYQAGTVATPQNAYQDSGLTIATTNPILCDASGRPPQWFVADGLIKLRITDKNGLETFVGDNLTVVGASSGGGGGGGTVDPTTIAATGDVKASYATGSITGWVRMNGRTIGSATSGATERANADTQALFQYLWNGDANLSVSGGRGASAAADWAANKTITLPDARGRVIASLDDMGNVAAGRLSSSYFGATATTLGAVGGAESRTLTAAQIPSITSSGANSILTSFSGSGFSVPAFASGNSVVNMQTTGAAGSNYAATVLSSPLWVTANSVTTSNSISVTSNNTGGTAHATVQPTILVTTYIKL